MYLVCLVCVSVCVLGALGYDRSLSLNRNAILQTNDSIIHLTAYPWPNHTEPYTNTLPSPLSRIVHWTYTHISPQYHAANSPVR